MLLGGDMEFDINRLEKELSILRRIVHAQQAVLLLLIVGFVSFVAKGCSGAPGDVVQAKEFRLISPAGRTVGVWNWDDSFGPQLGLLREDGSVSLLLNGAMKDLGYEPGLSLLYKNGKSAATLVIDGNQAGGVSFSMKNMNETGRISANVTSDATQIKSQYNEMSKIFRLPETRNE